MKKLLIRYLQEKKDMQIATMSDSMPRICSVYFVHDDDLNLYWTSNRSRQHSQDILTNSVAAVTVVRDSERKQALHSRGHAFEVSDDDLDRVHALYQRKYGLNDFDIIDMKKHTSEGRSYWVFRPNDITLWDEMNFPSEPKQQYVKSSMS